MKKRTMFIAPAVSAAVLCGLVSPAFASSPAPNPSCGQAGTGPQTCTYTGAVQTVVVPAGVDQVTVTAIGGDGGTDSYPPQNEYPGWGAKVTGTLAVQPGQELLISVGG